MEFIGVIIVIVSLVSAIFIVNKAQQFFMKIMGIDSMFFSVRKKIFAIVVVFFLIGAAICAIFGIGR